MSRLNPHGASLHVMRDASLNCEFAIPPELAARIRAENAARAARHRSRVPPTAEEEAAAAVEDGLEVLQVQLPPRRVDDISSAHSDPASEAVGGADTAVADSLDTAAAADGWAEETVDEKLPQAALLAATNTIGSKVIDGTEEGGATKAAAVNNDADDAADSDSDSEEDVHWDADDTSPESFAIKDAAALAAKLKAAKEYDAGPRDPDEPVLVVDPAAIMDEGAELDEAEMQEFQEGMAASLARDCDAATESLFARFAEVGACFYSTEFEAKGYCRRLRKRFPDRQFCVLRFPRVYTDAHDWRLLSVTEGSRESRSLNLLRTILQDCLRPLSWKVAIFEELQKLAVQSEPGRLKREARERARLERGSSGGGGWDDEDDDDFGFGSQSAFPSVQDFASKKERDADVLDMILAMLLQRQPPRQHRESEGEHFTELADLHMEVRKKWIREHGDPPSSL
eukprot:INCI11273.1.p1 GENE.INCI11273.1~~INCI11273.1.p1  ORF type:complete len:455 (-),score=115.35 INCI11273.1:1620-2984(-)